MPIQTPLKNVKVGPWAGPERTLMDVPEGVLTIVKSRSGTLFIRKRVGQLTAYSTGSSSVENANTLVIPDTLPEGLSAPGNVLPSKPVELADIPDYRVFLANSTLNPACSVLWFKIGSVAYAYNRLAKYEAVYIPYKEDRSQIDVHLAQQNDLWRPADNPPNQIFYVTDWEVQTA